jgi:putative tricarboxylic transport membrane protein
MRKAWQLASVAFVALAAFVLFLSFEYPYKDRLGPGPGFFPIWMALIMAGLALGLWIQTRRSPNDGQRISILLPDSEGLRRVLLILVALGVIVALLDPLGFRLSMLLFLLFLPLALGLRQWAGIVIFAALGSFGVFHVFYFWLKVPLPIGWLGI